MVKHNPHVGAHLVDHPVIDLYFKSLTDNSAKFLKPSNWADRWKLVKEIYKYRMRVPGSALAMNVSRLA